MYQNILILIDRTPGNAEAVRHGLEIAEDYGATVHLLYVMEDTIRMLTWKSVNRLTNEERERAEQVIQRVENEVAEFDIETVSAIRRPWPKAIRDQSHKTILRYAEENCIDLIVMGLEMESGVHRLINGNKFRRIVKNTEIPVLTSQISANNSSEDPSPTR